MLLHSRRARKLVSIKIMDPVATRVRRVIQQSVPEKQPIGLWLQLNHLRRVNVLARVNLAEQLFARGGVEIQHRERGAAGLISTQ